MLRAHCAAIAKEEAALREGGGKAGHDRQRKMGRLPVRERLGLLLDKDAHFFEIGLWAAYKMYEQWGKIPAAGVVAGIGSVAGVPCMIIANDATVKAGAFFPQTTKKVIRAQRIAFECSLPLIYLVDSAGVFLPMQDEIFPDEDDFGRIFRNNSVISAAGVPQFAGIMGNCVAGGAYLPVLCDTPLWTVDLARLGRRSPVRQAVWCRSCICRFEPKQSDRPRGSTLREAIDEAPTVAMARRSAATRTTTSSMFALLSRCYLKHKQAVAREWAEPDWRLARRTPRRTIRPFMI